MQFFLNPTDYADGTPASCDVEIRVGGRGRPRRPNCRLMSGNSFGASIRIVTGFAKVSGLNVPSQPGSLNEMRRFSVFVRRIAKGWWGINLMPTGKRFVRACA